MSKKWYPIVNYEKCVECGACIDHCSHSVYNKEKAPRPVVINPNNCVEGCTGCGSLCPPEAIEYFGDTKDKESENCCCSEETSASSSCDPDKKSESSCCSSEPKESECGCGSGGGCCG